MQTTESDRLSSLPNDILLKILSHLPLTTAAQTSTLSSRWAHIWTHLSHLRLDGLIFTSLSNSTIVNQIFSQLTSPQIHSFQFSISGFVNISKNAVVLTSSSTSTSTSTSIALHSWVPLICARNPINFNVSYCRGFIISAPSCVFQTISLVTLKLNGRISFDNLSEIETVNLPNLKNLHLSSITLPPQLLTALCNSCPKLEDLHLAFKLQEDQILDIIAPNLKSLSLYMNESPESCVFVIDAPLLENFVMHCNASYCYLVKKLSLLSKATIDLRRLFFDQGDEIDDDDYLKNVVEFFRGMSSVKSLELNYIVVMLNGLNEIDESLWRGFHNLIHLSLRVYEGDNVNWDAPIPLCLLGKLKKLDYSFQWETDHDNHVKIVRYILSNANVLEQLHICPNFFLTIEDENEALLQEVELCSRIFVLSRKSLACKIEFDGNFICGSSDRAGTKVYSSLEVICPKVD